MDPELTRKVEAVLFANGRFIDAKRLAELIGSTTKKVTTVLKGLQEFYAKQDTALRVVEEDGAWKMHVRDEYLELVSKIVSDTEVSGPVLETLAVIAWRSPALQSEVINIRGTNAYEHVKELVERQFIRKEPSGRSFKLRITDKFFEYFDVEGRDDIKKMFEEVEAEHRKKEMEVELAAKRLEEKMREVQEEKSRTEEIFGDHSVSAEDLLDEDATEAEKEAAKQFAKPEKKVDLDDLDAVLERSRKTREKVAADMDEMRGTSLTEDGEQETAEDVDSGDEIELSDEEIDDILDEKSDAPAPVEDDVMVSAPEPSPLDAEDGDVPTDPATGEPEDDDIDLEKARAIREKVMKDLDDL